MKQFTFFLAAILIIATYPLRSYAAEREHPTAAPDTSQQKEQYEKNMEERLKKLGRQLDELKAKAAYMTEQARKDINSYMAEAEKKQKAASRKLDEIRKESVKKWKKFTAEMDAAMDDFERAYEKAKSRFKE
ncbi:MAG: hypothetical protein ACM3MD_01040 [Betaproteobacteria bacterium]